MKFRLQQTDINGNPIGEPDELEFNDKENKKFELFGEIFCDCGYMDEKKTKDDPVYVKESYIKEADVFIRKHDWLCPRCKKYVQVG